MGADYIPERDHRAGWWMKFFARGLVERAEQYRITAAEAAQVAELVHAYRTALAVAWSPRTRSISNVLAKNLARKAAERVVRPIAQRIRTDAQVSDTLKMSIGLRPRRKRRRHVDPPPSVPALQVSARLDGLIEVRVHNSATGRRGKPAEAVGLELYERVRLCAVVEGASAADAPEDQSDSGLRFVGIFTRTPIMYLPTAMGTGDEVTVVARWVTRRGEVGEWGHPKSVRALWNGAIRIPSLTARWRCAA